MIKKSRWISSLLVFQLLCAPVPNILAVDTDTNIETTSVVEEDREVFIDSHIDIANEVGLRLHVLPELIISEMAILSDWGNHDFVLNNNYFAMVDEEGTYKEYPSIEDSIEDFYININSNVIGVESLDDVIELIEDDAYKVLVSDVLTNYDLSYEIDEVVEEPKEEASESDNSEESATDIENSESELIEDVIEEDIQENIEVVEEKEEVVQESSPKKSARDFIANDILNEKNTSYAARIRDYSFDIYTLPEELINAKKVANATSHKNSNFVITKEAETLNGKYSYLTLYGKDIGWIKTNALEPEVTISTKNVTYGAQIVAKNNTVDTLPYGLNGFKTLHRTSEFLGNNIVVTQEMVTRRGTFAYVYRYGKELGWVDINALSKEVINKRTKVNYAAKIVGVNNTIDTLPYGIEGFSTIGRSPDYKNVKVIVNEEATTSRGTFALISINGKEVGWIDKKGLEIETVLKTTNVNYAAKISTKNNTIDTLPYGVYNFKTIDRTSKYYNKNVVVSQEKETSRGTFALISISGKEIGWVDTNALSPEVITSTKGVHYAARIVTKNNSIDTLPYGVRGFTKIAASSQYYGTDIVATEEVVTVRGTFAKVYRYGKLLGWIDTRALNKETVTSIKKTSYTTIISKTGFTIDTLPYGISGFKNVAKSAQYLKQKVTVVEEKTTRRGTFALIKVNGKELGWLDTKAFGYTVFIDPGHGGSDPGATYYGVQEKKINLQVSLKLQKLLQNMGYNVIMLRTTDTSFDYKTERSKIANASGADIFVSVHHNAMPNNSTAHGIETYYYKYDPDYPSKINGAFHNDPQRILQSSKLANSIHNSLISSTKAYNRGVRRDTFAVLRETAIPAVLLELGYMSNRNELNKLTTDSYQNTLAQAIAKGIDNYFK